MQEMRKKIFPQAEENKNKEPKETPKVPLPAPEINGDLPLNPMKGEKRHKSKKAARQARKKVNKHSSELPTEDDVIDEFCDTLCKGCSAELMNCQCAAKPAAKKKSPPKGDVAESSTYSARVQPGAPVINISPTTVPSEEAESEGESDSEDSEIGKIHEHEIVTAVEIPEPVKFLESIPSDAVPAEHKDEYDNFLNHLEKVLCFAYQIARADNWTDILFAVITLIKMYYPDQSMMGTIYQAIVKSADVPEEGSIIPHSVGSDLREGWQLFRQHKMWTKFSYLVSSAMTLPVCKLKNIEFSPMGLELVKIEASKKQSNAFDVIDAVVETFTWMYDTGSEVMVSKSLTPILYSDQNTRQFHENYDYIQANYEKVLCGNSTIDTGTFAGRIDEAVRQCAALKRAKMEGPPAIWLQNRCEKLVTIQDKVIAKMKNSGIRKAPFGISLCGNTSVGKSTLGNLTMQQCSHAYLGHYDPSKTLKYDCKDKYDSTYTTDVEGVFLDDLANTKANFVKDNTPADIAIRMFNNMAAQAVKAELHEKGRVFIEFKVGVVTTNVKRLDAHVYSNCPESILRRFVHVNVVVKEKFRKKGTTMLDTEHPEIVNSTEPVIDVWDLDIEEVWVMEKGNKVEYGFRPLKYIDTDGVEKPCKKLDLCTYLRVIYHLAQKQSKTQEMVVQKSIELQNQKLCQECLMLGSLCQCVKIEKQSDEKYIESLSDRLFGYFDLTTVVRKLLFKTFLKGMNSFIDSVVGPFKVLEWMPINKIATSELSRAFSNDLKYNVMPILHAYTPKFFKESHFGQKCTEQYARLASMYEVKRFLVLPKLISLGGYGLAIYQRFHGHARLFGTKGLEMYMQSRKNRTALLPHDVFMRDCGDKINVFSQLLWKKNLFQRNTMNWTDLFKPSFYSYKNGVMYDKSWIATAATTCILATGATMFIGGLVEMRARQYRQAYLARRDALPAHVEELKSKYPNAGTYAVTAVVGVALIAMLRSWNANRIEKIKTNSLESPSDINDSPGWFDFGGLWTSKNFKVETDDKAKTMVPEQVAKTLENNICRVVIRRPDGSGCGCNMVFLQKCVGLIPKHVLHPNSDLKEPIASHVELEISRGSNSPGSQFKSKIDPATWLHIPDLDMMMVFIANCPDIKSITHLLPKGSKPTGSFPAGIILRDKEQSALVYDDVHATMKQTGHEDFKMYGCDYTTKLAKDGACMGFIYTKTKTPCIAGFHIGGNSVTNTGVAQTLMLEQYEKALKNLEGMSAVTISSQAGEIPLQQYGRDVLDSKTVHPKAKHIHELPPSAFIEVLGSTKLRSSQTSKVTESPLSKHLTDITGIPNSWGKPKMIPNWKAFNTNIDYVADPSLQFIPSELERARQDWLKVLLPLAKTFGKNDLARPLTLEESILGIDGKRFIDAIPMSTSMGFPVFGEKRKHFVETNTNGKLNRTPSKEIQAEMQRLYDCWSKGVRGYPVTTATLKDEPTKIESEKVRVFQAGTIAFGIWIRIYFLPIARFLQLHPLQSESAVGVNCFNPDWQELMQHIRKHSPDDKLLGLDYSKYDVRMNSQVTTAVMHSFIDLAREMGYDSKSLKTMQAMVADFVHPLIDFNGTLIMAYNMNTSGNNLTVNVNSTAGSFYLRLGFYHCYPDATDFRSAVAPMTYGDDMIGSVHPDYRKFNFLTYKEFLAKHGMKITLPDKSNNEVEFLDLATCDFLKRKSSYVPEIGCEIGKLDEKSIFKSLHSNLLSRTETREQVSISCCESALQEWFAYGREHYELRRQQLTEACARAGIPTTAAFVPFDHRVEAWKEKYTIKCQSDEFSPVNNKNPFDGKEEALTSKSARARFPSKTVGSDDPKTSLMLCVVVTLYSTITYALILSGILKCACSVKPQAEEFQTEASEETRAQNVMFKDAHAGFNYSVDAPYDPLRSSAFTEDVSLDKFFSRPINIYQESWEVNVAKESVINPWKLYFENPRVINRLSNYRLMSAKLKIKIMINGNSFYFGRMIASYLPLPTSDNMSVKSNYTLTDMVFLTQRPHIYLDPTNSQGGEMAFPFFTPWNALSTTAQTGGTDFQISDYWGNLGELSLYAFSLLQHANGATDPVTITILAWAYDVKLSVPTQFDATNITAQSDEYKLSNTASAVAAWSGALAKVPYIGMYARATQVAAGAVASVAKLFGYSRPADVTVSQYRPLIKSSYATTDTDDDLYKLTVDSKQELSIDPSVAGIPNTDELVLSYIAGKESWIYQFDWSVTDVSQQRLFNILVDPCIHRYVSNGPDAELKVPACCFAGIPFASWRGGMKFRFQAAASGFHKGRLKLVYDPVGSTATAEDNLSYITYLDLSEESDTTICIQWGQTTTYRDTIPVGIVTETSMFNTAVTSDVQYYGNGTLSVYVVNELTVPNSTAPVTTINMNVFVSACDDIEFAAPGNTQISRLRLDTPTTIQPQSMEMSEEQMKTDSEPVSTNVVNEMGVSSATYDAGNLVHFGERITSFRQLLKRYNLHEFPRIATPANSTKLHRFTRQLMPYWPGYTSDPIRTSSVVSNLPSGNFAYGFTTMLQYVTVGFAGYRGGTRHIWDFTNRGELSLDSTIQVSRENNYSYDNGYPANFVNDWDLSSVATTKVAYDNYVNQTGVSGIARTSLSINPILSFEVPYYSNLRFTPAKTKPTFDTLKMGEFNIPYSLYATMTNTTDSSIIAGPSVHVAAAEDFTPLFYTGPPILYYELVYPST